MNQIHSSIKFTVEGHLKEVHFLDTIVYKNENCMLNVKPYSKPTDKNIFLHFKSFHRRQLKINIPYGQFLRLRRNASKEADYETHAKKLSRQFQARGYPKRAIQAAEQKARARTRDSLFIKQRQNETVVKKIYWALDYTPKASAIINIIKRH